MLTKTKELFFLLIQILSCDEFVRSLDDKQHKYDRSSILASCKQLLDFKEIRHSVSKVS